MLRQQGRNRGHTIGHAQRTHVMHDTNIGHDFPGMSPICWAAPAPQHRDDEKGGQNSERAAALQISRVLVGLQSRGGDAMCVSAVARYSAQHSRSTSGRCWALVDLCLSCCSNVQETTPLELVSSAHSGRAKTTTECVCL